MIPAKNVIASSTLAKLYASKGLSVVAKPNTLLYQLVKAARCEFSDCGVTSWYKEGQIDSYDSFVTNIGNFAEAFTKTGTHEGAVKSQFDCELDASVCDLKDAIISHVALAKNVVVPVVADYAERVSAAMTAASVIPASQMLNVVLSHLPAPFADSSFAEMFSGFDAKRPFMPERVLELGARDDVAIKALLTTGDSGIDTLIQQWALTKDPQFFTDLWSTFFRKDFAPYTAEQVLAMGEFEALEIGMCCYLLGARLFDNIPEDAKGANLSTYQKLVAQVRDFGGSLAALKLERIAAYTKGDIMVVGIEPTKRTIYVNGAVYNKWLDNGGEIEVLFGLLVSDARLFSVPMINQAKDRLLASWKSWALFQEAAQVNNRFNTFRSILEAEFEKGLTDLTEAEKEVLTKTPNLIENIRKYFKEDLEHVVAGDMNDIYDLSVRLIAKARFFYTSGYDILSKMQTAQKFNPGISAREAALVATFEYIVDYLADQMTLTNKL